MDLLTNIFGGSAQKIVESVGGIARDFITTDKDRQAFELEVNKQVTSIIKEDSETARTEIRAKENIMVTEIKHGDKFIRWARPGIVWTGSFVFIFNYSLAPFIIQLFGGEYQAVQVPDGFWYAWTGVAGTFVISRGVEKVGVQGRIQGLVSGTKSLLSRKKGEMTSASSVLN